MVKKKGKVLYVPKIVITELDDIIREDNLKDCTRADAFKEFTKYARVGRETKRLMSLNFKKKKKLPPITNKKKGNSKWLQEMF